MKSPAERQTVASAEDAPLNPPRRKALLALGALSFMVAEQARGAGMGGMAGALLTGVFASYAGKTGLIQGNVAQFIEQVIGVVATAVYAVVMSFIILKVLDVTMGLRVNNQEEFQGLDLSQHGEAAYE